MITFTTEPGSFDRWLERKKQDCVKFLRECGIDLEVEIPYSDEVADLLEDEDDERDRERIAVHTIVLVLQIQQHRAANEVDAAMMFAVKLGEYMLHDEFFPEVRAGFASFAGGRRGGRKPGANGERDNEMAREFLEARPRSKASDSVLKARIGKRYGLSRSQSIVAINRALKPRGVYMGCKKVSG